MAMLGTPGFGSMKAILSGVLLVGISIYLLNQFAIGRNLLAGRLALNG